MEIDVCFCCDELYFDYFCVSFSSLVDNNKDNIIRLHLVQTGISKSKIDFLMRQSSESVHISIYDVQLADISKLEGRGHISKATYYRLLLPNILSHLDRVIYLDCDILVNSSLVDLWSFDITKYYLAAVENPFFDRHMALGIELGSAYFNAGVLMINLNKWRAEDVMFKALKFLESNSSAAKLMDQDALNYVCQHNWYQLDVRWNVQTVHIKRFLYFAINRKIKVNDISGGNIVHFSSSNKPWQRLDWHPLTKKYLSTARDYGIKIEKGKISTKAVLRFIYRRSLFEIQVFLSKFL
jgi:lipopolysaccharide biosynthesis glycosyltransferase